MAIEQLLLDFKIQDDVTREVVCPHCVKNARHDISGLVLSVIAGRTTINCGSTQCSLSALAPDIALQHIQELRLNFEKKVQRDI